MVFVSFILFVAVIIVFFEDKNVARYGLRLSFLLITIIFSLRYDYGNDYFNYIDMFKEINRHTTIKTAIENTNVEFGWTIICRLLCHFNPQIIISLSTIALTLLYYNLISKYVPSGYRWFAVFIFLFHPNIFVLDLSMIRQGLTSILCAYSLIYMYNKQVIKSILFFVISLSIHSTSIIMAPFILLSPYIERINIKLILTILCGLFILLLLSNSFAPLVLDKIANNDVLFAEFNTYFSRPEESHSFGFGVLLQFLAILPFIISIKQFSSFDVLSILLYSFIFLLIPFTFQIQILSRLSSYFLPFGVLLFPRGLSNCNTIFRKGKTLFITSTIIMVFYIIYSYIEFFSSATYKDFYSNFSFI